MNKILVFTNKSSWYGIDEDIRDLVVWESSYPKETNPITLYKPDQSLQSVDNISEEGVYLVYDAIDIERLRLMLNQCPDDIFFVLIHSKPDAGVFSDWNKQSVVIPGMHANDDELKYYPLFKILADNELDKTNRIIRKLFMETIISNFTDGCRYPKNNSNQFRLAYNILRNNTCLKKDIDDFLSLYNKSDSRIDYIEKLNVLKTKLKEEL